MNISSNALTSGDIRIVMEDTLGNRLGYLMMHITSQYVSQTTFIRKGIVLYAQSGYLPSGASANFVPLKN